ncbi:MAG: MarR family transcriptional regulator [Firmicutes bacterium]|nr:MarR family transcriptional regulator [Alicyclobacillaceae bacterium]MCL6498079.1 MarR family transcriptional regulator [Bacillota bacterium]
MERQEAEELFESTFVLFRSFGRRFRREREPHYITPTQYHALALVAERGTVTLMELAGLLRVAGPTATRTIEALVQKQLLVRDRDPQDRRIVWVRLSPAGARLLDQERAGHVQYFQNLLAVLPREDQTALVRIMKRLAMVAP